MKKESLKKKKRNMMIKVKANLCMQIHSRNSRNNRNNTKRGMNQTDEEAEAVVLHTEEEAEDGMDISSMVAIDKTSIFQGLCATDVTKPVIMLPRVPIGC